MLCARSPAENISIFCVGPEWHAASDLCQGLDGRINRIKNAIRALFVNQGIEIDTGKRVWCLGRERIDSFRKPLEECGDLELWQGELDLELSQLDDLTEKMATVEISTFSLIVSSLLGPS